MSRPCLEDGCQKKSDVFCYFCKKDYCNEHFEKHAGQLKELGTELADFREKVINLKAKPFFDSINAELNQARLNALQMVNEHFAQKSKQYETTLRSPGMNFDQAEGMLNELKRKTKVSHQDMDQLRQKIIDIDTSMKEAEKLKTNRTTLIPLVTFAGSNSPDPRPAYAPTSQLPVVPSSSNDDVESSFKFSSNHRIFNCSNKSGVAMASNQQSLLLYENGRLNLLNSEFKMVQSLNWPSETIFHLAWIAPIHHFLVITDRQTVYVVNPTDLTAFQRIKTMPEENWWSATASTRHVFISTFGTDPKVVQFDPAFSFQIIKQFKTPFLCQQEEYIDQINILDDKIIVTVSNALRKSARCDVRSLNTFEILWTCILTIPDRNYQVPLRCCLLPTQEFFIIFEDHVEILHINKNRQSNIIYHRKPVWNGLVLDPNTLVIRTDKYLFVYSI